LNVAASSITATSVNLLWAAGNGRARLVIGRKGQPVSFVPQDFTAYNGNTNFGSGQDLGNGNFVLSNTTDAFAGIHNLQPKSTLSFRDI
jgi:hypothetical protein